MMLRLLALPVLLLASAARAQFSPPVYQQPGYGPPVYQQPLYQPPVIQPVWSPASQYVTTGQDEPGYRNWYMASPRHAMQVTAFNRYLDQWQVGGVVPTWQLLRTASQWRRCGAQPFEVPPMAEWPNVVQTLRYIRDYIVPAVGAVEPVSAYRNPVLNICAGGAPQSSHRHFQAVDLVPLQPITRERLMRTVCAAHLRRGEPYQVGLGFYAFVRFHIDTTRFRKWGTASAGDASPCSVEIRRPAPVLQAPVIAGPAVAVPVPAATAPIQPQPLPQVLPTTSPPTQPQQPVTTTPSTATPAAGSQPYAAGPQPPPLGLPTPQTAVPQADSAVGQIDPLAPR